MLPENLEGSAVEYLYSYQTDAFVTLSGLSNDDLIPPSLVAQWERTLGFELPHGPAN